MDYEQKAFEAWMAGQCRQGLVNPSAPGCSFVRKVWMERARLASAYESVVKAESAWLREQLKVEQGRVDNLSEKLIDAEQTRDSALAGNRELGSQLDQQKAISRALDEKLRSAEEIANELGRRLEDARASAVDSMNQLADEKNKVHVLKQRLSEAQYTVYEIPLRYHGKKLYCESKEQAETFAQFLFDKCCDPDPLSHLWVPDSKPTHVVVK